MDNILTINNENYLVLNTVNMEGEEYSYLAKLEDDDITGEFYVYKKDANTNEYVKITNSEDLRRILLLVTADLM